MATDPCLVLYGNSVFLAGLKAELERDPTLPLELISMDTDIPRLSDVICRREPCAVLFDLGMDQPSFLVTLLRELPHMLVICVDPSSDEMLVITSHPVQALAIRDLVHLIIDSFRLQQENSQGA